MPDTPTINLEQTALLIMDYQPGIIARLANADALINQANQALRLARQHGIQVGYVRVALGEDDYRNVSLHNTRFMTMAKSKAFNKEAPETQIDSRVAPQSGDIVVRKVRVGAFSTTDLDDQLKAKHIDTLILAGIATSGVVLSTIRDASDRDYRIFVLEDACADTDAEVHRVLMGKVFPRQANVISVADLPELLASK